MLDHHHESRRPPGRHFGQKEWACLAPSFDSDIIHIVDATPKREYFHPTGLQPMYARLNHPTPTFCFNRSADREAERQLGPHERVRGEGVMHMTLKHAIAKARSINLTIDGEPTTVHFDQVKLEHIPRPPNNCWRIDAVCRIRAPMEIKARFGGYLNIEIVAHKGVDAQKELFLKSLPCAAVVLWPYPKMQREIEAQSRSVVSSSELNQRRTEWLNRSLGFLRSQFGRQIVNIPGEGDPRAWSDALEYPKFNWEK